VNNEECGFQQGKDLCQVKHALLSIVKQVGIINDIFLERILGMVTSDDPYAYVVAKILHLPLYLSPAFLFSTKPFLFALPAHGKRALLDEMGDGSSIPCAGDFVCVVCVCVCVCVCVVCLCLCRPVVIL
jgi:hypothetical protein